MSTEELALSLVMYTQLMFAVNKILAVNS
jgi:hypothetical protein